MQAKAKVLYNKSRLNVKVWNQTEFMRKSGRILFLLSTEAGKIPAAIYKHFQSNLPIIS